VGGDAAAVLSTSGVRGRGTLERGLRTTEGVCKEVIRDRDLLTRRNVRMLDPLSKTLQSTRLRGDYRLLDTVSRRDMVLLVIVSFACRKTERLWSRRRDHGLPPQIERVALRKLTQLHRSRELRDLRLPPGNCLETLHYGGHRPAPGPLFRHARRLVA
jgi:hypothetical protein